MPAHHTALIAAIALLATQTQAADLPTVDEGVAAAISDIVENGGWALEPNGWTWAGANDGVAMYTREALQGRQYRRVWVRYEYREPVQGGVRSSSTLEEVDCTEQRTRTIQYATYPEQNLRGRSLYSDSNVEQWSYAMPSTFGARIVRVACGAP